ncbi:carboxyl transferase domain-containing protein [Streptomyces sp. NPDC002845]
MDAVKSNASAAGQTNIVLRRIDEAVHVVEEQHTKVRITARERVEQLLDEDSFVELDETTGHHPCNARLETTIPRRQGVVTGYGTVDGRPVAVFAQDHTVVGGALGEAAGRKITKVMDFALKTGCPVIAINDAGRSRILDSGSALGVHGEILRRHVHSSGVVPQISLIMGSCAGGAVHSPALADFTVMVERTSHMITTGTVIQARTTLTAVTPEPLRISGEAQPTICAWTDRATAIALRRPSHPRPINTRGPAIG